MSPPVNAVHTARAAQCPPSPFAPGLTESWTEGWRAAVRGGTEVLGAALSGRLGPMEYGRWITEMAGRRPPRWTTPHKIVFEAPVARLRDFTAPGAADVLPTIVLPPQAGHDSSIVDYSVEQSQMRTLIESGLEQALSLDWIGATPQTRSAGIDDYLQVIDRAVEHCGGRVNLVGDCQGGWLATIYAALHPQRVNTLTIAGAPIDFHCGEPLIHEVVRNLAPGGDMGFYEALVASAGGVLRGDQMLQGFMLINPADEVARQLALLCHVDDERHLERYREFEDWFKHTQDIPGEFYLWIVRHLFSENQLIRGELEIGGRTVSLADLDMPLNLLAGARDHITPPDQVFALADYAATPRKQTVRQIADGGHLGLFMGREALRDHWPVLLAAVRRRS